MYTVPLVPFSTARTSSGALLQALGRALAYLRSVLVALRHRREVMQLCTWDDRMIEDVGLTRSELVGALQVPLTRDPSQVLAAGNVRRPVSAVPTAHHPAP